MRYRQTDRILALLDSITTRRQTRAELLQDYTAGNRQLYRDLAYLIDSGRITPENTQTGIRYKIT